MKFLILVAPLFFSSCISLFIDSLNEPETKYSVGFINEEGNLIIPYGYEEAGEFVEGLAPVKKSGLWGFINKKGEVVIDFQFKDAKPFSTDPLWAPVEKNGIGEKAWGYIDKKGNWMIEPSFYNATVFRNGVAEVATTKFKFKQVSKRYDKYFLTKDKKYIYHNGLYSYLAGPGRYSEGMLPSCKDGKWGFKDVNDKWIVEPKYTIVRNFSDGYAAVQIMNPNPYTDCELISESEPFGLWGYIDKTGKEIIPPKYRMARDFVNGIASVDETFQEKDMIPGNTFSRYFIDKTGKKLFDTSYAQTENFLDSGYAFVGQDEKNLLQLDPNDSLFIDTKGKKAPFQLEKNERIFTVRKSGKDFLLITFQVRPNPERYEHEYIARYYSAKKLTKVISKDFPPCFGFFAYPPNCMNGEFSEGLAWVAKKL